MSRHGHFSLAVWPCFVVLACILLVLGCQDGSGPNLVTSPEGEPTFDGVKPPPPPPPQPPADPAIAFSITGRVRDGRGWRTATFLKVMNADGTNLTSIYMTPAGQGLGWRPAWSPDGRCIAFTIGGSPNPGIYFIDVSVVNGVPTGTNLRLFQPSPAWMPAWSPDGTRIAYMFDTSPTTNELRVAPVSGGPAEILYYSAYGALDPSWSPDGMKIAFAEDPFGIRVLDLTDMTVTTVVPYEEGWSRGDPSWARTQDALVFDGEASGAWADLYIKQLPSGTPTLVCSGSMPDWSPDDRALVFRGEGSSSYSLYRIELATGIITRLMSGGGEDHPAYPAWRRF